MDIRQPRKPSTDIQEDGGRSAIAEGFAAPKITRITASIFGLGTDIAGRREDLYLQKLVLSRISLSFLPV